MNAKPRPTDSCPPDLDSEWFGLGRSKNTNPEWITDPNDVFELVRNPAYVPPPAGSK